MNDPSLNPSSELELETRITAVVLGEASDFERDQIDRLIEQRPDLAAMKSRFESVNQLLHGVGREEWPAEDAGDWKLPAKKRDTLVGVLSGESGKLPIAAAPEGWRPSVKRSRFAKIGALICAACLLVGLGVWRSAVPRQMALVRSSLQSTPELHLSDVIENEKSISTPVVALDRSSRPTRRSSRGRDMGETIGQMGRGLGSDMGGMGGGMGRMGDLSGDLNMGMRMGMDVSDSDFDQAAEVAPRLSLAEGLTTATRTPSDYAGSAAERWPEAALGLGEESEVIDGLADRSSSTSSRQAMEPVRSNRRLSSSDRMPALAKATPLAPAASAPQSAAPEQKKQSFNFVTPLSLERLRLDRSQLLESVDGENAPEIKVVEPAESKNMPVDEVQADGVAVNAGATLPRSNREAHAGPSFELVAPHYGFQPQAAKKEKESKQLFRTTDKRGENQSHVDFVPESSATTEPFSTFSLHVSDVSFKLAAAALTQGQWPETSRVRIEEFVNALDYGDPLPSQHEMVSCQMEQCIDPFVQQRNLLRVSLRTAAAGRASTTALRLTLLLDNSGSMERIDRQQTVRRAFETLTQQLQAGDQITLISFARTPRLLADRVSGEAVKELVQLIENLPSEGGTNIEAALQLAWEKAREQWAEGAQNRIILLTDGAVNLGDANPEQLSNMVSNIRETGIAFDAAGISANGLNDEVLEALTRKGDGRYYLLDSAESADDRFARQIAGALRPSAMNVKVQVEFNPERVGNYRLLGFEKHILNKEDFRNDQVDAAEMAAAEAGVAVYQFEPLPNGEGDVGSVSVRFRDMSTGQMVERRWPILYQPSPPRIDQAPTSMRLAAVAAMFAAKLSGGALGATVDLKTLSELLASLPPRNRIAERVRQLEQMIQQAREISGE